MKQSLLLMFAAAALSAPLYAQTPVQETATPTRPRYATLVPVHFDYNKTAIRADDRAGLDATADILKANPDARINIVGNTDARGDEDYNRRLGLRRAVAIKAYLVEKGISADRLNVESMGESQPADPADNEDAWAKNRRVEFRVIGDAPLRLPSR